MVICRVSDGESVGIFEDNMTIRDEHYLLLTISFQQSFCQYRHLRSLPLFFCQHSLIKPFLYKMVRFDPRKKNFTKKKLQPDHRHCPRYPYSVYQLSIPQHQSILALYFHSLIDISRVHDKKFPFAFFAFFRFHNELISPIAHRFSACFALDIFQTYSPACI